MVKFLYAVIPRFNVMRPIRHENQIKLQRPSSFPASRMPAVGQGGKMTPLAFYAAVCICCEKRNFRQAAFKKVRERNMTRKLANYLYTIEYRNAKIYSIYWIILAGM